jgi:hypothetical protein
VGFFAVAVSTSLSSAVEVVLILRLELELVAPPPRDDKAAEAAAHVPSFAEQVLFKTEVDVAERTVVRGAKAVVDAAAAKIIQDEKFDTFICVVAVIFVVIFVAVVFVVVVVVIGK